MAKPLVLDLHIPYCIRPENYLAHFNAVGSNAEKKTPIWTPSSGRCSPMRGELDGYEIRAVHLSGGSASVMAPDLLGDVLRTVRTHLPVAQGGRGQLRLAACHHRHAVPHGHRVRPPPTAPN